jgi:hypothetical protein
MTSPGISALSQTLIGVEATHGTGNPTTHWRGTDKAKDMLSVVFPPEKVGKFGGTLRSYIPKTGGEVELDGDATFEQLNYIWNSAFYHVDPTTDVGSSQIRTWNLQTSSSDPYSSSDLDTLVIQSGDNVDVERFQFGFVREWTLSGKSGEGCQIQAVVQTRAPTTDTAFTAIGDTDLDNPCETLLMSMASLYIDPSTDTPGTTQASMTILDFSLKHTTGWVNIEAKDGRLDFTDIKHTGDDDMTLNVSFEHNGVAVAEKNAWRNQTERVIRLKLDGTITHSSTDTYTTNEEIIDLYGKWQTFGNAGLEEQKGDNIYKGVFKVGYSAKANVNKAKFVSITEMATLP